MNWIRCFRPALLALAVGFVAGAFAGFKWWAGPEAAPSVVTAHPRRELPPEIPAFLPPAPEEENSEPGPPVEVRSIVLSENDRKRFGFRPEDVPLAVRTLPSAPEGGKISVKREPGGRVGVVAVANPPRLLTPAWEPRLEGFGGVASPPGLPEFGPAWDVGVRSPLLRIAGKHDVLARVGYESRPWGGGWVLQVGVSLSLK